jgi:mevalonate pyrophosphate decarboxylase
LLLGWLISLCVTEPCKKKKATNDQENSTDDDTDFNGSNEENDDKSYLSRVVDIAALAKQNQSITLPGHIVMWKDHMTND